MTTNESSKSKLKLLYMTYYYMVLLFMVTVWNCEKVYSILVLVIAQIYNTKWGHLFQRIWWQKANRDSTCMAQRNCASLKGTYQDILSIYICLQLFFCFFLPALMPKSTSSVITKPIISLYSSSGKELASFRVRTQEWYL